MALLGACTDGTAAVTTPAQATSPSGPTGTAELDANATVARVVDGDTIVATIDRRDERVRLLGIDTPESVAETRPDQCYGEEASTYLKSLLPPGTAITLILDEEPATSTTDCWPTSCARPTSSSSTSTCSRRDSPAC
ncbi:MAG: thermonuclease family protein [Acidimicrobiales bacterium]